MPKVKKKILIVDDNEMNRELLSVILKEDYEFDYAADGEQAILMLDKHRSEYSVMLLDIVMPKMDGFDVLRFMNEKNWIKYVPVVLISTEYSPAHIDTAFDLGVFDFINRPFDSAIVQRRVANAVLFKGLNDGSDLQFMSVDTDF